MERMAWDWVDVDVGGEGRMGDGSKVGSVRVKVRVVVGGSVGGDRKVWVVSDMTRVLGWSLGCGGGYEGDTLTGWGVHSQ